MSLTNVSLKTVNQLDKIMYDHKKVILEDIYKRYIESFGDISKEDFLKQFLERKRVKKIIKKRRRVEKLEEDKCRARVWHCRDMVYMRCKFGRLESGDYCKVHMDHRNYGDWEENK